MAVDAGGMSSSSGNDLVFPANSVFFRKKAVPIPNLRPIRRNTQDLATIGLRAAIAQCPEQGINMECLGIDWRVVTGQRRATDNAFIAAESGLIELKPAAFFPPAAVRMLRNIRFLAGQCRGLARRQQHFDLPQLHNDLLICE